MLEKSLEIRGSRSVHAVNSGPRWIWVLLPLAVHTGIVLVLRFHPGLYGPGAASVTAVDLGIYFRYASLALAGAVPYRDYLVEYPPLALGIFLLPRLFANTLASYRLPFAALMLLFDALGAYLVALCLAERLLPRRLGWYALCVAALYPFLANRYDWAPMAMAFAATQFWFSGRSVLGGATTALGTLLKLFPATVAALALTCEARQIRVTRLRGVATFTVIMLIAGAAWLALGGMRSLEYQLGRGIQIETLWAGVVMAVAKSAGVELSWRFASGSATLVSPNIRALEAIILPAQGLLLLLAMWHGWRSRMADPFRSVGAAILGFAIAGKVLSPQYMIWLIPFLAVARGRTGRWSRRLFLPACVLTTLIYPLTYGWLLTFQPWAIALLNVRNGLLVGLLAVLLFAKEPRAGLAATNEKPHSDEGRDRGECVHTEDDHLRLDEVPEARLRVGDVIGNRVENEHRGHEPGPRHAPPYGSE
jgi:hypothetical protein